MPSMTWQYVAGFFDGEGCLTMQRDNRQGNGSGIPLVTISQSNLRGLDVLSGIAEFLTKRGIKCKVRFDQKAGTHHRKQDSYLLRITGRKNVLPFIAGVLPHVWVKRTVCQDHWRYWKMYPSLQGCRAYTAEWQAARKGKPRNFSSKVVDIEKAS